jgi:sulfite exporter TauE/SafE
MITEITLFSAFIAGLLGSGHCIGMCGGIVGALTMSLPDNIRQSHNKLIPYILTYNIGRIGSYTLAGVLMGFLGAQFAGVLPLENPRVIAMWVSSIFMILLGLYIGGWWQVLTYLEKAGQKLWRKIEPLGRRLLPVKSPLQALGLGILWGWLPCGLVYSILAFSLASGSALQGGLLMLSFGIGTLPMLFAMGATSQWLTRFAQKLIVRRIAGAMVILFGLFILFGPHHKGHHNKADHNQQSNHENITIANHIK